METIEKKKKQLTIKLPDEITHLLENAVLELKARGASTTPEELINPIFIKVDEEFFRKRVEALTPDDYMLELAKNYPEVLKVLSQHAKKLLEAAQKGEPVRLRRKREPVGTTGEAN